jgi:general secretion pathway protein G
MIVRNVARQGARTATRAAFTLMEIMVVVAIIVILAGVSVVAVTRYMEQARVDATHAKLKTIETALSVYYTRNHEYPASLEVLTQRSQGLDAYLDRDSIFDEWGHEIMIDTTQRSDSGRPLIYSGGPNPGDPNSMIRNWNPQ